MGNGNSIKSEYEINSTYDYLELMNAIISEVEEKKYSVEYGLICAVGIFKIFSGKIGDMDIDLDNKEHIINIAEIYLSVDFIYRRYLESCKSGNQVFLDGLDFPFKRKKDIIAALLYMKSDKTFSCTITGGSKCLSNVYTNTNILDLFRVAASSKSTYH